MSDENQNPIDVPEVKPDVLARGGGFKHHVTDDMRGKAMEAARRAMENSPGGRPQATLPKAAAAGQDDGGEARAAAALAAKTGAKPAADGERDPADTSVPANIDPPADPELAERVKAREHQQRIREQERRRYDAEREQFRQREEQLRMREQQVERLARAAELAKTDPVEAAKLAGIDEKDFILRKAQQNTPEAKLSDFDRALAAEREERKKLEQYIQQREAADQAAQSREAFVRLVDDAEKYPTIAAVYKGETTELLQRAFEVQAQFAQQFGRQPTREEIAHNLEKVEKRRIERYRAALGATTQKEAEKAAETAKKAASPTQPKLSPSAGNTGSGRDESAKRLTDEEKRDRATQAAKRAREAYEKSRG